MSSIRPRFPISLQNSDEDRNARDFAILHGWALPATVGRGIHAAKSVVLRSVGTASGTGPRAFLDERGAVHPGKRRPSLEIWWRLQHGPVQRIPCLGQGLTVKRLVESQGLTAHWTAGPLKFQTHTLVDILEGIPLVWHHVRIRSYGSEPCQLQLIGALRPFGPRHSGLIPRLAYHTRGLFLVEDMAALHDAGATLDGVRLSNAATGDTLQLLEGTLPPEGGLSVRDLREKSLRISCPLGLCSGATTTVRDLLPGGEHTRWWAMPLEPVKPDSIPWHLLTENWSRSLLQRLEPGETHLPNDNGGRSWGVAAAFVRARLTELSASNAETSAETNLPSPADLPILVQAASCVQRYDEAWTLLGRALHHQDSQGLLGLGPEDPLLGTSAWAAATLLHLQRHPILSGVRSPFPSADPWPRALRLAIMALGSEFRHRSREGWQAARTAWLSGNGQEHAAMAYTLVAIRLLSELREVAVSHEEATALLRVHAEIRQLLNHSVAQSLEHSTDGLLPPGPGLYLNSYSVTTLQAFLLLSPDDCPVSLGMLRATARGLYRKADRNPGGCLEDPWGLIRPSATLRLALVLRELGYERESESIRDRASHLALETGGGEWLPILAQPDPCAPATTNPEDVCASALETLLAIPQP